MTYPLPAVPAGIPIRCFQLVGAHGAVWNFEYLAGADQSSEKWRSPGRDEWFGTVQDLNAAHGPLVLNHPPFPAEDRTKTVFGADGQQWAYSATRGGWVKDPAPPEEDDPVMAWNWLVYVHGVAS
jgi:hypothetical protein